MHLAFLLLPVFFVPLQGFVSENPTAPIQLKGRQTLPCLNEFCRLGCICSSLSHTSRTSHCGWPACMFGCSCLKQKVVLLKNLDSCDSSPSPHHGGAKKKKKGRRMKMAYGKVPDSSSNENEAAFIRLMINSLCLSSTCSPEGGRKCYQACRAGSDSVEEERWCLGPRAAPHTKNGRSFLPCCTGKHIKICNESRSATSRIP